MHQRRWPVLLGLPLVFILGAAAVIGIAQPPARALGSLAIARLVACAAGHAAVASTGHPGTSWKTIDRVDASGAIVGRQLFVATSSGTTANAILPVESSISGPVDGLVVVTEDDGTRSSVLLVDVAAGCSVTIDERADVVRNAIIDPHDGAVFAHLVARDSRVDLGTFRIARTGSAWSAALVAEPLVGALAREVGQVFGTGLAIDGSGHLLAVQSCTDLACLTRIFDLARPRAAPTILRGADQGPLVGFAGQRLVTWSACVGNPCGLSAWDVSGSGRRSLAGGADSAAITADGRRLVVLLANEQGTALAELDVASGRSSRLRGLPSGARPLGAGPAASQGLEVASNQVALAIPGSNPLALSPDSAAEEALP